MTWVVMHRLHHRHSDGPEDPHSPVNVGFRGLFKAQLDGYARTQALLLAGDPELTTIGKDLSLSWPTRSGHWYAPYIAQVAVGVTVALAGGWLMGLALVLGLMSHVAQGAIINYFGHAHGGRNFDIDDNSRNNHPAAWLVLGEGFQNNHHRYPSSARFSYRSSEVDFGFAVCRILEGVRVLKVVEKTLMPRPASAT
jgi:stearoyl-CoA desaturase (delta-9 desaturase)